MKINLLTSAILLIALSLTTSLSAQVTIGSGQPPAAGALLDLKQEGTTTRGMVLPRVKLADIAALTMGTNVIPNANNAWTNHAGLVVYNISGITPAKCAPIPDGLYVWDGAKWNGINVTKADPATLTLSGADINFPSGLDLRTLPTTPETFAVNWTPSDKPVAYTNEAHSSWGGISFNGANTPPDSGNLTTSPTAFSLLPDAMTPAEITANPFRTKENTLTFTVANECGSPITEVRVVNQTNKALTLQTPLKKATASSSETNGIKSNAQWKLKSIVPNDNTNAIFNASGVNTLKIDGNSLTTASPVQGEEKNDNTSKDGTLSYEIIVGATKARYSALTFEDAAPTKRFSDVTVTVLQCTNVGVSPSIEQWAAIAGFAGVAETKISDADDTAKQINIANTTTGIAWHRDQDGNVFLSSSFHATDITGDSERWMIHNLAAKTYATGVTPVHALSGPNGNADGLYNAAYWAYPKAASAITVGEAASIEFTNNPRLGLLYTWNAATAGKGRATGQTNINDGENVITPQTEIRQGICPNGWHLPSDVEWTQLENEFNTNTTSYSSAADIANGTITVGVMGSRGTTHGKAMKETCERYSGIHQGTSNSISSTARPGFDLLFPGYAGIGLSVGFGNYSFLWSSSGSGAQAAWVRVTFTSDSMVSRQIRERSHELSVRCKKD